MIPTAIPATAPVLVPVAATSEELGEAAAPAIEAEEVTIGATALEAELVGTTIGDWNIQDSVSLTRDFNDM